MLNTLTSPFFLAGVAIVGATIFVSCRSGAGHRQPVHLGMQTVSQGPSSGISDETCVAIRSQEELDALWRRHGNLQLPPPQAPAVDFESSIVVGVFLGSRPSAGYAVEIRGVDHVKSAGEGSPATLVVRAVESVPMEGAIVAQVTTAPFHLVMIDGVDGEPALDLNR